MCTVSWLYHQNGYQLFFNRDELKTRKPALPPTLKQRAGVNLLTPEDGDAGGTWIAVNEFGLTVCLLNYYDRPYELMAGESFTSRGLLVLALAEQRDVASAQHYLNSYSMRHYRACHVLMLDPNVCASATWNGEAIEHNNAPLCPMSSSSFETRFVITGRQEQFNTQFADIEPTAEGLFAFQKTHKPEKGPFSVCMHRAEAGTVSHSQIDVSGDAATFAYIDGAPCEGQFLPPVTLPLRKFE